MARNRMIKTEFWADEKIGSCTPVAQLLFIGSWNFADDSGVCRANDIYLRNNIFSYSACSLKSIKSALEQLREKGLILLGDFKGEKYLYIINFLKHQKIDTPSKFRYINEDYKKIFNTRGVLGGYSGMKGKGKGKEKEENKENEMSDFEKFYSLYPKKQSKGKAEIAYNAIKDEVTIEQLINGVKSYCEHIKKNKVEIQFIKMPATWLNQKCWEDVYTTVNEQEAQQKHAEILDKIKTKEQALTTICQEIITNIRNGEAFTISVLKRVAKNSQWIKALTQKYQISSQDIEDEYYKIKE